MLLRSVGETCVFTGGTEPHSPQAKVVATTQDMYHDEVMIHLFEAGNPENGLLISLATLQEVVKWTKKHLL